MPHQIGTKSNFDIHHLPTLQWIYRTATVFQSSDKLHTHLKTIKLRLPLTFDGNIGTRRLSCLTHESVSPNVTSFC
jgi:hypothetical protein